MDTLYILTELKSNKTHIFDLTQLNKYISQLYNTYNHNYTGPLNHNDWLKYQISITKILKPKNKNAANCSFFYLFEFLLNSTITSNAGCITNTPTFKLYIIFNSKS